MRQLRRNYRSLANSIATARIRQRIFPRRVGNRFRQETESMIETINTTATSCVCDLCAHTWATLAKRLPERCPNCHLRKWNGFVKMGRPKKRTDKSRPRKRTRRSSKIRQVELELPKPA